MALNNVMLSVANKPITLSEVMPSVVVPMLRRVLMLSTVVLCAMKNFVFLA
jgi:hypothetical protein